MNERKIEFLYNITHRWEAGLVLISSDILAIRENRFNIQNSFVLIDDSGEVWLRSVKVNGEIRHVKLLLKRSEISKLAGYHSGKSMIIMPLSINRVKKYFKVNIGVGTAKNKVDKREKIKERDERRRSNNTDD